MKHKKHLRKQSSGRSPIDPTGSEEKDLSDYEDVPDEGEEAPRETQLDDDILDRIFSDFVDPDRIARMEGIRVAAHFVVKMRGT